jgi:DNA repair ATPase RecN
MENNGHLHVKRSPERSAQFWRDRLEELEQRHVRKRRAMDEAIDAYKLVAREMSEAQDLERRRPRGVDVQAQFGAELEQARLAAERLRVEYHNARVSDLTKLAFDVSRARDQLIAEVAAVDALQREVGTACEQIRQALWYAGIERDSASNYVTISDATREAQLRAARELPEERGRGNYYGRGLL